MKTKKNTKVSVRGAGSIGSSMATRTLLFPEASEPADKDANEKPVMLSARVHPRTQYGLKLLSRIHGMTIADTMDWAVNLAMTKTEIGPQDRRIPLRRIIEDAWANGTDARRVWHIYDLSPELLDFEERAAWGLVTRCPSVWRIACRKWVHADDGADLGQERAGVLKIVECLPDDPKRDPTMDTKVPIFSMIEPNWEQFRKVGVALARAGATEWDVSFDGVVSGKALRMITAQKDH